MPRPLRKVYVRLSRSGHRTLKPSGTGNKKKIKKPYTDTLTAYGSGDDLLKAGKGVFWAGSGIGIAGFGIGAGANVFRGEKKPPIRYKRGRR